MRIIGGKFKGRAFSPGKTFKARPTTDFAKENLFNILENFMDWGSVEALDLFAGTGSISYELVSRGCKLITAVELDFSNCRYIKRITKELQLSNLQVIRSDAFRFVHQTKRTYDLVFADPPFDHPRFGEVAEGVLSSGVVKPGGLFILEHSKAWSFEGSVHFSEQRKYGSVHFSFFRCPVPPIG